MPYLPATGMSHPCTALPLVSILQLSELPSLTRNFLKPFQFIKKIVGLIENVLASLWSLLRELVSEFSHSA